MVFDVVGINSRARVAVSKLSKPRTRHSATRTLISRPETRPDARRTAPHAHLHGPRLEAPGPGRRPGLLVCDGGDEDALSCHGLPTSNRRLFSERGGLCDDFTKPQKRAIQRVAQSPASVTKSVRVWGSNPQLAF